MVNILINADDLAFSTEVNEKIFYFMRNGKIKSSTILANGPAFEHAMRNLGRFPECSFGIHLNLTEFFPISMNKEIENICMQSGEFGNKVKSIRIRQKLASAIFDELDQQIIGLRNAGVAISHIDSHHHVHTCPSLFFVIKRLQIKHRIFRVRLARNVFPGDICRSRSQMLAKHLWNTSLRLFPPKTKTTDFMCDLQSFNNISQQIDSDSIVEIMVHPGHSYSSQEDAIMETDFSKLFGENSRIISYWDI